MTAALPGPRTWHPLGSHHEVSEDMIGFARKLRDTYGDVAGFRVLMFRCAAVFDPDAIGKILVASKPMHHKPFDLREMRAVLGDGLLTSEDDLWRHQRRLIQPAFHNKRIHGWAPLMLRRLDDELARWPDHGVVDVHESWMRVTVEIVAEAMFGADVADVTDRVAHAVDTLQEELLKSLTAAIPLPLKWPTPSHRRLHKAAREVEAIVDEMIAAARARTSDDDHDDLLSALLEVRDDDGKPMPDRQIRDEVLTIFLAGHETTALTLAWTLYLLAMNPEVHDALADEIDRELAGADPDAESVPKLKLTRAVIDEAMRLYPPAWGIGRELLADVDVCGQTIPKGTQTYFFQSVTHRDPRWFQQPDAFRPDRWLNGETEGLPRYAYFPFGGGPRACIGAGMAIFEAVVLLARFTQRYRVTGVAQDHVDVQPAVTLRPANGLKLHVAARNAEPQAADR